MFTTKNRFFILALVAVMLLMMSLPSFAMSEEEEQERAAIQRWIYGAPRYYDEKVYSYDWRLMERLRKLVRDPNTDIKYLKMLKTRIGHSYKYVEKQEKLIPLVALLDDIIYTNEIQVIGSTKPVFTELAVLQSNDLKMICSVDSVKLESCPFERDYYRNLLTGQYFQRTYDWNAWDVIEIPTDVLANITMICKDGKSIGYLDVDKISGEYFSGMIYDPQADDFNESAFEAIEKTYEELEKSIFDVSDISMEGMYGRKYHTTHLFENNKFEEMKKKLKSDKIFNVPAWDIEDNILKLYTI